MFKHNLKSPALVRLCNGEEYLVINDIMIGESYGMILSQSFNPDLTHKKEPVLNIVAIWSHDIEDGFNLVDTKKTDPTVLLENINPEDRLGFLAKLINDSAIANNNHFIASLVSKSLLPLINKKDDFEMREIAFQNSMDYLSKVNIKSNFLDLLAMTIKEWPEYVNDLPVLHDEFSKHFKAQLDKISKEPVFAFVDENGVEDDNLSVNCSQWLDRRAEIINQPDLSEAPEWANMARQDSKGNWYWLECSFLGEDLNIRLSQLASKGGIPAGHKPSHTLMTIPSNKH